MAFNNKKQGSGFTPAGQGGGTQKARKSAPIGTKTVNGKEVPVYKKSGAKKGITKNGGRYTSGWRARKGFGLTSYFCAPTKNTTEVTSKVGKLWLTSISVKIVNKDMSMSTLAWGLMESSTGKVIIQDLGLVINPNAPNGGVVADIGRTS